MPKILTCNDCYHKRNIHAMLKNSKGILARCDLKKKMINEKEVACDEFKKFIGFHYRNRRENG